jgi:hypothetical protein
VGWGNGAGTASKSDTSLFTETDYATAHISGTVSKQGTGSAAKWQNVATVSATGARTITNAGCFSAANGGTLYVKGSFDSIALATNDSIVFTFTLDPA